jgi:two-component system, LytTR family, sensor kinase
MFSNIHKKRYFHLAAWIGFLLIILCSADELDRVFVLKSLASFVPPFFLFYALILWVFPKYLGNQLNLKTIVLTLSLAVATVFLRPILHLFFPSDINAIFDRITFWVQFRYNVLFVGIAFAYHYASQLIVGEQEIKRLEMENSEAKLALLKNQINPHFLYNTLSMLYTKALPLSEELATMVNQLSSLLRYTISDTNNEGKVSLANEIKYIEDYISLNETRFNKKGLCHVKLGGDFENYKIAPLLLICFIENAFKHGDLVKPIHVIIEVLNHELYFSVENHIAKGKKDASSGIGLSNVQNRLALIYSERHQMNIDTNKETYKITLKVW